MEDRTSSLQKAKKQLDELMPELYRTLNNWSLEPTWERAARDCTSVLSEFLNREANYRDLLEASVHRLEERIAQLEDKSSDRVPIL